MGGIKGKVNPLKSLLQELPPTSSRFCVGKSGKEGNAERKVVSSQKTNMQEVLTKSISISDYLLKGLQRHCLRVTIAIVISQLLWGTVIFLSCSDSFTVNFL